MYRFLFTLFLFAGLVQAASAQREFANLDLPLRNPDDLVTIADDHGNVCVYFYQNNKLYLTLLNSAGEVVAKHELPHRWNQMPQVLSTRVTDSEFIFYRRFVSGRREYVRPFAINSKNGTFRIFQDIEVDKERNAYFVGGFADNDHFYMLYTDRKERLHLYRTSDGPQGNARMDYQVFEPKMPATRVRNVRMSDLVYIHPDMEQTVQAGYHQGKIYTRQGNVLIIFDGYSLKGSKKEATTELLTLNWDTGETSYRSLPALEHRNTLSFNSFLYQDKLFRLKLERDEFNLTAYSFDNLQPIKTYTFSGEEQIAIKSTPVYQRGVRGLFKSDADTLGNTSKVMKKLAEGIPAVTVGAFTDSTIQLTIGSFAAPTDRNSQRNRMVRTPDRYYQTSRGLMYIPGRWVPAYSIPSYQLNAIDNTRYLRESTPFQTPTGPGVSTFFRSVLDSNTLTKVPNGEAEVAQDKLEKYEQELKSEPDFKTVYRYGNKLHYGYYDRKTRTFKIMEFAAQ